MRHHRDWRGPNYTEGKTMKIATLKISGRFTEDGSDAVGAEGFDEEALEDGPGQALLVYDNGRWKLFTSEEEVDAQGVDEGSHGSLEGTDLAKAVSWARRKLAEEGYEVAFRP
jgi:hypothetical protein